MPHRIRPVMVVTGRQPFEVCVLLASTLCGLAMLVSGLSTRSVQTAMPGFIGTLWELSLVAGGVISLVGIFWPGKLLAQLALEAMGVFLFGASLLMYVVAMVAASGAQAIVAATFIGGLSVAAGARVAQIGRDIRRVGQAVEAGTTMNLPLLATEDRR